MNYRNLKKEELIQKLFKLEEENKELKEKLDKKNQIDILNYQHLKISIGKRTIIFYDEKQNKKTKDKLTYLYIHKNENGEICLQSDVSMLVKPIANNSLSLIIKEII